MTSPYALELACDSMPGIPVAPPQVHREHRPLPYRTRLANDARCAECARWFPKSGSYQKYCSLKCQRRATNRRAWAKRKLRKKEER